MDITNPKFVAQAKDKNKQWSQWLAVTSASLSFFSAGICFAWSSPSLAILQSENGSFPVSNSEASWIASCLPIGCAVGPIIGAWLSRYLGPKQSSLISVVPYLLGFILIVFASSPVWLYASRFLSGIGVGFGQTATPIYVAEIAENHNRGALMTFFVLTMGLGALFMSCAGPYMSIEIMAEIASIFPILLLATLVFMPESPYYLMRLEKEDEAKKSLRWLRRQKNETVLDEELKIIRKSASENVGFMEAIKQLKDKPNPKALGIINMAFISQQICGAVMVLFYQEQIYKISKPPINPAIAVMISSVIGNFAGIISIFFVDRWGRKPIILISALGCALSTGTLGTYLFLNERSLLNDIPNVNWTPVIALNALQIFFAFGLSPVPSTQLGELFSSSVKELAFCLLSVIAAVEGFIITKLYQVVLDAYGMPIVFWGLSSLTFLTFIAMCWMVPETKGKSFLEIQNLLSSPKKEPKEEVKLQHTITRY